MKNKMRFLILLLGIVMALSIAGCHNTEDERLEGDVIEISSSSLDGGSDPRTGFYCSGRINKEIESEESFLVELSFGVLNPEKYDRKNQRYIEITAGNEERESYFIKKINGGKFYTDDYACFPSESGMQFNHTEIVEIPVSLLTGSEGWFIITVSGYDSADLEHCDGLDGLDIHYIKSGQKIYFNT